MRESFINKAKTYIDTMCSVKPNRRTGSAGNRSATDFFARIVRELGYHVDTTPFPCLDYETGAAVLQCGKEIFEVYISPYSTSCEVTTRLVTARSVPELEKADCTNKVLLMIDELCAEQLMPKNFVFYNPEHHKHIYTLLETKKPAAIVTAPPRNPAMVGAIYPYSLIEDGDFNIPVVYCTDGTGEKIAQQSGQICYLSVTGKRTPATASNVIASTVHNADQKIIICAHIDAYGNSPGALDNASGTTVLLLLAEMLKATKTRNWLEIVAFNGEDNYSAGGQMDYIRRYGNELGKIALAVNIDDVGYKNGKTAFSVYCYPDLLQNQAKAIFNKYPDIQKGPEWYQGDHMIFVQQNIPTIAFTSNKVVELMATITHTVNDEPENVDYQQLVELAEAITELVGQKR
jgi:aminopeptidase YwaD